jgi:hypothetical protein
MSPDWLRHKKPLDDTGTPARRQTTYKDPPESRANVARTDTHAAKARSVQAKAATAPSNLISHPQEMHLIFVDEEVTIIFLTRLLAAGARVPLLDHTAMSDVKQDLQDSRIPRDLNCAMIAARLLDVRSPVIIDIDEKEAAYLDQPVRLEGVIKQVGSRSARDDQPDREPSTPPISDLRLRISTDRGPDSVLWLNSAVSYGWTKLDLGDRRIVAIGLLRRPRSREVVAAAIMQLEGSEQAI